MNAAFFIAAINISLLLPSDAIQKHEVVMHVQGSELYIKGKWPVFHRKTFNVI